MRLRTNVLDGGEIERAINEMHRLKAEKLAILDFRPAPLGGLTWINACWSCAVSESSMK
jgi:hypothetical protein